NRHPQPVDDGEQVGVVGLEAVDGDREAGEQLLRAAVVAGAGVGQGAQQREAAGDAGVSGQQLAQLQAGDGGGDGFVGAAVLGGGERLGVVGLQVAGPAVQPDHQQGRVVAG